MNLIANDFRAIKRQVMFVRMKNRTLGIWIFRPKSDTIHFCVKIDKILDVEETNPEFVVERFNMFDLNRGEVMQSWAEEIDNFNLQIAIFLPQGGE